MKKTLDMVKEEINLLEVKNLYFTTKEVKYLPEILKHDERINALVSGFLDGNTWLIVCTSERIIFVDKGMLYGLKQIEIPLNKINSIGQKQGLLFGEIHIWDGANKMTIKNINKTAITPFINAVNNELDKLKKINGNNNSEDDFISKLERLSLLRDKGIINENEFNAKKKVILEKENY